MLMAVCGLATGDDGDAIKDRIVKAKASYESDVKKANDSLAVQLERKEETAKKAGDLLLLKKLRAEREALVEKGDLPKSVSVSSYNASMKEARERLEAVLIEAKKEYTRADKIKEAEEVEADLALLTSSRAPLPRKTKSSKTDGPLSANSIWKGTIQLSTEENARTTYLVITERTENQFKGLHMWDDGGRSQVKDWSHVEGEIKGAAVKLRPLFHQKGDCIGQIKGDTISFRVVLPENRGTLVMTIELNK
jgi:hypothetical protein